MSNNCWIYKGRCVDDISDEVYGFVYMIVNKTNNKFYIGKRAIKNSRGGKNYTWRNYWGTCKELTADIKLLGERFFSREILHFARNKAELTYYEAKEQFARGVIEPYVNSYNGNILGKFYRKLFYEP